MWRDPERNRNWGGNWRPPFPRIQTDDGRVASRENTPKVTFSQLPEIVEQDSESETESTSRDENIERQASPQLTTYETILGDDWENSESKQVTVCNDAPERLLDTDHDYQNESQQTSDVPTGRESRVRRPLVGLGWTNSLTKINNEDRLRAWLFPVSRVAWSNASSPFVLIRRTDRAKYKWFVLINLVPQLSWYETPHSKSIGNSLTLFPSFTFWPN